MKKIIIITLIVGAIFIGCNSESSSDSSFDTKGYASTDKLVSAEWLSNNIDNVKIVCMAENYGRNDCDVDKFVEHLKIIKGNITVEI